MEVLQLCDDFSKGHYRENPYAGNGWFGGHNFYGVPGGVRLRYATQAMSNTGLTNDDDYALAGLSAYGAFVVIGTDTWSIPIGGGAPVALTDLGATLDSNDRHGWCNYQGGALFTNCDDATYKVLGGACTELTSSPGGAFVATLGDRIYVAHFSGAATRIRYSAAADENDWPAANFIDIGPTNTDQIVLMRRQRNSLIIATAGAAASGLLASQASTTSWWRLSGTPGSTLRIDPITPRGPNLNWHPSLGSADCSSEGYGSRVWFSPQAVDGYKGWVGWIDGDTPEVEVLRAESDVLALSATPFGVAGSQSMDAALVLASGPDTVTSVPVIRCWYWRRQYGWARLTFPFSTGFAWDRTAIVSIGLVYILSRGGNASNKPEFKSWATPDTMQGDFDDTDDTGAAVTGELHLPIHIDASAELHVQAVAVDYRHFSSATTMTCAVETLGIRDATTQASASQAFTVSGAPSTAGIRARKTFHVGSEVQPGCGFQVKLTACRDLGIERVTVLGQSFPSRT